MKREPPARPASARPASTGAARLRDAAVVLPLLGLFAWMPPVIGLFAGWGHVLGVPLIVAWLFGVWLTLIAAAAWLSRRLDSDDALERDGAAEATAHGRKALPNER